MKCPICAVDLAIADRQGIEIDYCPKCRGIWLDRGEIDKIIERSQAAEPPRPAVAPASAGGWPQAAAGKSAYAPPSQWRRDDDDDRHRRDGRKRKGFLSELLDFD